MFRQAILSGDMSCLAGTPTFHKRGVPGSYFTNPSENPDRCRECIPIPKGVREDTVLVNVSSGI